MRHNVVTIDFSELQNEAVDFSEELEAGFGAQGLGIIAVSNVPGFTEMRSNLLNLAQSLSSLPENALKELEDPASRFSFGWSHGKEFLESGQPDELKASFYANPIVDRPTDDPALIERYPSYCRANLWPGKELPDLESSFKKLGSLIVKVGLQLAAHCDKHVSRKGGDARLTDMLKNSLCHKGRLLHYYPSKCSGTKSSSWCGWHVDHGSLTGLTCAMYTREGREIDCPDSEAGLYVRTRSGAIVKATFGKDDIAYQVGEATELMSNGAFHATPHCVRTAQDDPLVERNTFAVFMQPHWDEELVSRDRKTVSFGDFSESLLSTYYGTAASSRVTL
ncbi:uncharacterized protein LOC112343704 [Selaginella moellendorffii]|uniref:uncharacterized protein LOC112343704 n=1 Tax=Selaginella moellendorffii TaxID=88036 RepID=UPI000D1C45AE|nr:uncharacterized protein LOC112343704 [Selaginella moellendorffii]|eukprot:XP_024523436.1 uncharacterized protein LOC112343704 [Selaginella moellendorffii]